MENEDILQGPDLQAKESQLRSTPGVPVAAGSSEAYIGLDESALLAQPSIDRLNLVPIEPPEIVIEEINNG